MLVFISMVTSIRWCLLTVTLWKVCVWVIWEAHLQGLVFLHTDFMTPPVSYPVEYVSSEHCGDMPQNININVDIILHVTMSLLKKAYAG